MHFSAPEPAEPVAKSGNESAPAQPAARRRHLLTLLSVVLLGALVVGIARNSPVSASALRDHIRALGPWSQVAYVFAFAVVQPLGPSGHVFILSAALLWPPYQAFVCALAGALSAQALSITVYRTMLRRWAARNVPARVLAYEARLLRRPGLGVMVVRLCTFTGQLAAMALAVSRVPIWPLCWGTILGLLPGIVIDIWLSDELRAYWSSL